MKKKVTIGIILLITLIVGTGTSYIYFTTEKWNDKIYPGISIQNIDVGGLTKEEAVELLDKELSKSILEKSIKIKVEESEYVIGYNQLNTQYDISTSISKAYEQGKEGNFLEKYKSIKSKDKTNIDVSFNYSDGVISETIGQIKSNINKEVKNATISIDNSGSINTTPEVYGKKLNEEDLHKKIVDSIDGCLDNKLDVIEAVVEVVEPSVKESELAQINSKISESHTSFKSSDAGRSANIDIAAKKINGTLLMPGEVFSFNDIVGERSEANGFKNATVIVNNEFVDGLGGGICQVSTTLYDAILYTGLYSVERLNHSLPVGYANLGQDATVAWGSIDYKFKNSFEYPVYIQSYTYNKNIYFNVYSNSALGNRSYKVYSKTIKTMEPEMKEIEDPNLYEGERVVKKQAYEGKVVETYREIYENGTLIKTELVSKDTYPVVNGEVQVGTKPKEDSTTGETENKENGEGAESESNNQ